MHVNKWYEFFFSFKNEAIILFFKMVTKLKHIVPTFIGLSVHKSYNINVNWSTGAEENNESAQLRPFFKCTVCISMSKRFHDGLADLYVCSVLFF